MATPTSNPFSRSSSLLERAAQVYDFGSHLRARQPVGVETPGAASALPVEPATVEDLDSPTLLAIPEELRAPVGHELPDDFYDTPELSDIAGIDRGLLAEAGMIVPGAPVGPLAEEFRLIKRQLLITRERIARDGQPDKARTVLVCSARPGDGKTFSAINLALSMAAERDTEVLLVDADFAKPDVLAQLGLAETPGLLDALADGDLDVEQLVIRTDVGGLSILPAGTRTATDTELLASNRTRAVIARLLEANPRRIVVFDSPPALAASPAAVLAMLVGQVMLVVRADHTPESELKQAVQRLDACDHIALVLNAMSFVPGAQRFGTYYGQEIGK
ncbi:AAA family ATPase [Sphingomonas sp. XXL09]|uniref:AAA family ATPase n=1 Tax=Sphingomonas sp. XXL09 TaxID=3457787 RepID=UPI00406BCDD6